MYCAMQQKFFQLYFGEISSCFNHRNEDLGPLITMAFAAQVARSGLDTHRRMIAEVENGMLKAMKPKIETPPSPIPEPSEPT